MNISEVEKGLCAYMLYMHIAPFDSPPSILYTLGRLLKRKMKTSRVENEKGLCAYILYIHIAPVHSPPSILFKLGRLLRSS